MRRRYLQRGAALVAVFSSLAAIAADSTVVKGVSFGATEAQVRKAHPSAQCQRAHDSRVGDRMCSVKTTYAGAKSTIAYFLFDDRMEMVRIRFPGDELKDVHRAITDQYGKGKIDQSQGLTMKWMTSDSVTVSGSIMAFDGVGEVQLISRAGYAAFDRRDGARSADRKKDM